MINTKQNTTSRIHTNSYQKVTVKRGDLLFRVVYNRNILELPTKRENKLFIPAPTVVEWDTRNLIFMKNSGCRRDRMRFRLIINLVGIFCFAYRHL